MADAVVNTTTQQDGDTLVVHLNCISDGTGEAAVIKVIKANLVQKSTGVAPSKLSIEQVRWCIQGFTSVRILFDHTTDDVGLVLNGNGYDDMNGGAAPVVDPASAGGLGDILLTSVGAVSGATYDITLKLRKLP
jgi:hypothetical protein